MLRQVNVKCMKYSLPGTRDQDSENFPTTNLIFLPPPPPDPSYSLPFSYSIKLVLHQHQASKIYNFLAISNEINLLNHSP